MTADPINKKETLFPNYSGSNDSLLTLLNKTSQIICKWFSDLAFVDASAKPSVNIIIIHNVGKLSSILNFILFKLSVKLLYGGLKER